MKRYLLAIFGLLILLVSFGGADALKFKLNLYKDLYIKKPKHQYIGVKSCKVCHKEKEQGFQYQSWLKTKHAKAYQTLKSKDAKKIGKKYGIKKPHKSPKCLQCHVTAYKVIKNKKYIGPDYRKQDGVGCESCHGPGGDFAKEIYMKDPPQALSRGLTIGTPKQCTRCHNKKRQPPETYKGPYDLKKMNQKIAHYRPGHSATAKWQLDNKK